ncbi:TatD family hydrolase [Patescibacteria group bacterium]|nr:TatD family hydrolase [Patescibacteria group bacterium]
MIDTHAHLNFQAFKKDYAQVIERNFNNGLKAVINIGSNLETSKKAVEISQEFENCFSAIGLHPIHVKDEYFNKKKFSLLIKENKNKVKAIGETGLDFYHNQDSKELQKKIFCQHIELAQEYNLPIVLHCRGSKEEPNNAYLELLEIIKNLKQIPQGVIHCFSADWPIAQEFLNLGFYIGFTGPITFKNATLELLQVVEKSPLDRILLETDCPFLSPEPYRGQRNEPVYVRFIAQKISEIKNISFDQVVDQTTKNAKKLFRI